MENPVLHLKEVSVYQKNNLILSNVNLTVGKGELVYLIGKTGSGKSSLIKLLYGDLPLTKGQGKVVGFNLKNLTKSKAIITYFYISLKYLKLTFITQTYN